MALSLVKESDFRLSAVRGEFISPAKLKKDFHYFLQLASGDIYSRLSDRVSTRLNLGSSLW